MTKILIIANPTAGKGGAARRLPEVMDTLSGLGLRPEIVHTERRWHAAELAERAACDGYDIVAAAGGDGTVNEVINGLIRARASGDTAKLPVLSVLPVGRGNDFAFGTGLPTDWQTACRLLAHGKPHPVDIARVQAATQPDGTPEVDRYFGNGIGIGFDTLVNIEAAKLPVSGFAGYGIATLRTILLHFHHPLARIEADDTLITQPCLMISVMNGRRMGGGFLMAPQSASDDGMLDICLAHAVSRLTILGMIPRFMRGTQAGHKAIRFLRARKITVTALHGRLPVHADGETISVDAKRVAVEMLPGAVKVLR